jgi:hypothetical protein
MEGEGRERERENEELTQEFEMIFVENEKICHQRTR